uniref:Uncharacterized protein n=1 Tax=Anguilla anguilla TaxID=7936 RepID=A0A0E9TXX0_ANGAN
MSCEKQMISISFPHLPLQLLAMEIGDIPYAMRTSLKRNEERSFD